jgi:hypothetical protein
MGNRIRDLLSCSIMLQPAMLPHAHKNLISYNFFAEKMAVVCKGVEEAKGGNSVSVIGSLSLSRFVEQGYWTEKEPRVASRESVNVLQERGGLCIGVLIT